MTGIGMKRDPNAPRKGIRRVSKKQARRTAALKDKLLVLLAKQVELYGSTYCEAGCKLGDGKCGGDLVWDHVIPRSRHPQNVDGFYNAQVLCSVHNGLKGSRSTDYRDGRMQDACRQLDQEDIHE
jgi:5-methylcytosine-specific restriction endonuclease McrA